MRAIIHRLDSLTIKYKEVMRFLVVGVIATAIQYGVYYVMNRFLSPTLAMTIAYIISFIFNFIASTRYTFQVKANVSHGLGFAFSHVINYLLQVSTLNVFLWIGLGKNVAPIPMFCICVPINFLLVRFFLKR